MASSEDPTSLRATKRLTVKEGSVTPKSKGKAVCLEGQSSEVPRVPVIRRPKTPEEGAVKGALEYFEAERLKHKSKKKNYPISAYRSDLIKRYPNFIGNTKEGIIGPVPGVEVGLTVRYRDELRLLGIHREIRRGIDSMDCKIQGFLHFQRVALCVIQSGVYQDCEDTGQELYYVGEGGRNQTTNKQYKDQTKCHANDSLRNNYKNKWPVRLVRGRNDPQSPSKKFYVYHGLYNVISSEYVEGVEGFMVYKFRLERQGDQIDLAWREWNESIEANPAPKLMQI